MLTEIVAALGPLKLVVAGILFFNLALIAVRQWLALGVVGLSVGEVSAPRLWEQVLHLGRQVASDPATVFEGVRHTSAGSSELAYLLMANALLATAIWCAVRSLQLWARATVKRHEEAFWQMVERDEREWRGVPPAGPVARNAPASHTH